LITPIWRLCSFTASAFRVLGSKVIGLFPITPGAFVEVGIEGPLFGPFRLLLRADEGLHGWHERTRNEQQVQVENADDVEHGVEAGHNFPGFDRGDKRLRQANLSAELPLPPATLCPRILYLLTQIAGQSFES
jgi:hypothetical protein